MGPVSNGVEDGTIFSILDSEDWGGEDGLGGFYRESFNETPIKAKCLKLIYLN